MDSDTKQALTEWVCRTRLDDHMHASADVDAGEQFPIESTSDGDRASQWWGDNLGNTPYADSLIGGGDMC